MLWRQAAAPTSLRRRCYITLALQSRRTLVHEMAAIVTCQFGSSCDAIDNAHQVPDATQLCPAVAARTALCDQAPCAPMHSTASQPKGAMIGWVSDFARIKAHLHAGPHTPFGPTRQKRASLCARTEKRREQPDNVELTCTMPLVVWKAELASSLRSTA